MSEYWDGRAVTLEGAQRAAWDEDEDDGHCDQMLDYLLTPLVGQWRSVEIGCGPGRLLRSHLTIGVDSSPNMVRHALALGHAAVLNDGRTLPFPDESVEGVYSVLVFQHVPDDVVASYCAEAHRILKPGGVFVAQYVTMGDVGPHNHPRSTLVMNQLVWPSRWHSVGHWDDESATDGYWDDESGGMTGPRPEWAWIRCVK